MTQSRSERRAAGAARARQIRELRPAYQAELALGTDRFFEPRRPDCPWCRSTALRVRLRTTDLVQHKPGRFTLERCRDCGHVFQNPRLSSAGLDFYYRDFYDGLGEERMGGAFTSMTASYRSRARAVAAVDAAPGTWLDIGTGHGHFCATAKEVFPGTAFHGLDISAGVELAQRHGRLARGLRGGFLDLAPRLAGQYDVVSMYHYLEHSTDPRRELTAAREVLKPGGLLQIEVPDPQSRYARLLGRWWLPWFQPQHQHLIPVANLRRRLGELGFTVLQEQHREAHLAVDLLAACGFLLDAAAPAEDLPWRPAASSGRLLRALRPALFAAGVPALLAAAAADRLIAPFTARLGLSNAYRVLARRDGGT